MNLDTRTRTRERAEAPASPSAPAGAGSSGASTDAQPQPPRSRLAVFWHEYVKPFFILALVLFAFRSSVADWNDVPTGSMKPTVLEGDRIFVNKLAYDLKIPFTTIRIARWNKPSRGEIVVFYSPKDGTRMVKRVVAVPGDTIEIRGEHVIINASPLSYAPLNQDTINQIPQSQQGFHRFYTETLGEHPHAVMMTPSQAGPQRMISPRQIAAGEYFLMGDNRDNSYDSRFYGPVKQELILGRSSRVILSLDRESWWMPRLSRFFKPMP